MLAARTLRLAPRTALLATRSIQTKPYTGMPFDYSNKRSFGIKFVGILTTGFAVPFIASYYQLWKAGST
ncbi:hypothetical protein FA95DRAFT_1675167 [Auriscalpium vulgare]|uniref:Uncharacterized protein n=1 Tax=Auriscalpium vulgare TaxID=40419 RepID=A0ACB8S795_9AGAM|nr:hypothetical protein FA95DRAFT_1675167 [Auriscalpium vulgare]